MIDFTGGKGYIEEDSGRSFPAAYTWLQANDFDEDCSVMLAVAKIPVGRLHFRGCICVIHDRGKEYRLATYLGVRILRCDRNQILLRQGRYCLHIHIYGTEAAHTLQAPKNGNMSRSIREIASCPAAYSFYDGKKQIFHRLSRHTSYEFEPEMPIGVSPSAVS